MLGAPEASVPQASGRRPPIVARPHDIQQHRRIEIDVVLVQPQPAVKPAQPERQQIDPGFGCELDFTGDVASSGCREPTVRSPAAGAISWPGERLVIHRDLPRPRVVPAGDVQDGHVGVIAHMIDDGHPFDVPERRFWAAAALPRRATLRTRAPPGAASCRGGPEGCRHAGGSGGRSRSRPAEGRGWPGPPWRSAHRSEKSSS